MGLSMLGLHQLNVTKELRQGRDRFKPLCPVKLQGIACRALIDSGNLVHPCISEDYAKTIFGKSLRRHLKNMPTGKSPPLPNARGRQ